MNNIRGKMEQKSTEELKEIFIEIEENYPDETLNEAIEKTLSIIREILVKRGVDVKELQEEKNGMVDKEGKEEKEQEKKNENVKNKNVKKEKSPPSPTTYRQFRSLSFLSSFIKVTSIIFFVIINIINIVSGTDLFSFVVVFIVSLVILIPYYAFSELIYLMIDIEKNSRLTSEILNKFYRGG